MESQSPEVETPIPLNNHSGSHVHNSMIMIHQDPSSQNGTLVIPHRSHHHHHAHKTMIHVRYKECLKNHAAAMGMTATDGCGEFMPTAQQSLICSACGCHRNFHRQEILPHPISYHHNFISPRIETGSPNGHLGLGFGDHDRVTRVGVPQRKRFRTKFTKEQKERMVGFAERIGWRMQKKDESLVQDFCQEIGVRRRVFKVWMHNNKNNGVGKNKCHFHDELNGDHHQSLSFGSDDLLMSRDKED